MNKDEVIINARDDFYSMLIEQEIKMFILLRKKDKNYKVDQEEFDIICDRRGFNDIERESLLNELKFIGIDNNIELK